MLADQKYVAVHLLPAIPVSLPLEPAGRVTHDVIWQVQRWSDERHCFVWVDGDPVPCSGEIEAEMVRVEAACRNERNIRVLQRSVKS